MSHQDAFRVIAALAGSALRAPAEIDEPAHRGFDFDALLTQREAAELLRLSESFLEQDRLRETPRVPFVRLGGRAIRYSRSALVEFIAACSVGGVKAGASSK